LGLLPKSFEDRTSDPRVSADGASAAIAVAGPCALRQLAVRVVDLVDQRGLFIMRPAIVSAIATSLLTASARSSVSTVTAFGSNPGALRMRVYAPTRLRVGRPLVVVLHGCRQDAATFAVEAGWLALAQQFRCALLLPEQTSENNRGRCFNWFQPDDVRRGSGEAMSIRQMIRKASKRFGSDPRRIFVVGFSAGGGMTAALLAAYPRVFAAGGVVAGMPVGCARTPMVAMLKMQRAVLLQRLRLKTGEL